VTYRVELSRSAAGAFERAPKAERVRLERAIDVLAQNPRPPGKLVKAIQGSRDAFLRLRAGNYRLMYGADDPNKMVLILGIIHRKDLEEWLRQRH
jgi:mRNA interferase RelE/StbE